MMIYSMLKTLEQRYGDPGKLVESVVEEVQRFRKIDDDDNKKLIQFINTIVRGYHDLKNLRLEKEISNAHGVSVIENKLLSKLEMDWYRHIHKRDSGVDKTDTFPHLLDFLLVERDALEYGSSDLKYTSKQVAIHTVQNTDIPSCLIHAGCTHSTNDCRQYTKMSIDEKYALLNSSNSCFGCLAPNHQLKECTSPESCGIDECQKYHNKSLHDNHHSGLSHAVITSKDMSESICLLPIMKVRVVSPYGQFLNTLWDSGAGITLVTNSKASALKLIGKPVQLSVIKVGGCEEAISSKLWRNPEKGFIYVHMGLKKSRTICLVLN